MSEELANWRLDAEHRHFVTSDPNVLWEALEESCDRLLRLLERQAKLESAAEAVIGRRSDEWTDVCSAAALDELDAVLREIRNDRVRAALSEIKAERGEVRP